MDESRLGQCSGMTPEAPARPLVWWLERRAAHVRICGMDVELRPVTDADVEVFYEQQLDPEARRMAV